MNWIDTGMISVATYMLAVVIVSISASPTTGKPQNICANDSLHFLPHTDPNVNSKFFICENGIAREDSCPENLVFDRKHLICWWPEDTVDSEENVSDSFWFELLAECMNLYFFFLVQFQMPEPIEPEAYRTNTLCANNSLHFVPHPDSKTKYYICKNRIARLAECTKGLEFNTTISMCWVPEDIFDNDENVSDNFRFKIEAEFIIFIVFRNSRCQKNLQLIQFA